MKATKFIMGVCAAAACTFANAQGLEGIIVEKYYITDANDATDPDAGTLAAGSTVYRVFVDMAPGYKLETVFGNPDHELRFGTSTFFFNNEDRGAITGNGLGANFLNRGTVLLDSYLSMGAGGSGQWAVVKGEDTNGSIGNIDGFLQSVNPAAGIPFGTADGLVPGTPPSVTLVSLPGVFDVFEDTNFGPEFSTNNAAWAVLGGTQGPDAENRILIAQMTTDGEFSFNLNLRLGAPDGGFEQYVASNPVGNEIEFAALNFPIPCNANGGTLTTNTANRSFCVGTGNASSIQVEAVGASGTNQRWALVNSATGDIVATRANNSNFNLDIYPAGNYSIRYIRFENDVNVGSITNISQANQLTGCFGIASNTINLNLRPQPIGGVITTVSSTAICSNATGQAARVQVLLTSNTGENSVFGIVNAAAGNQVVAVTTNSNVSFEGIPAGSYRIVHLAFQPGVQVQGIEFASQLEGCFALSNFINVSVVNCAPVLQSMPNPTDGQSFVQFTLRQDDRATLEVFDMSGRLVSSLFNGMASAENEYRFQFNGSHLPNGIYTYRLVTGTEVITEKFILAR